MSLVSTVSTIRINWGLIRSGFNLNLDSDRRLFIRYSKCSTQICIDSVDNPNAEFSHLIEPQTPVSTVSTVNSTTSIPDECIDSVDNWVHGIRKFYSNEPCIDSVDNPD